ncbi:MAG TPA: CBS domain-containing protein [Thermoanaerobaculia bacterium]|nr:CBS domain-containing protein [Thermoanaerobaculia bacterium]
MTAEPICATPETPLQKVAALMTENRCGAIPIVDNGRIAGIVTDRDIVCRAVARGINPQALKASDVMTRRVATIAADQHAEAAEAVMKKRHVRRLLVVDNEGHIVGIVSATDLAIMTEELASGVMFPKLTGHVPKKTSPKFRTWL